MGHGCRMFRGAGRWHAGGRLRRDGGRRRGLFVVVQGQKYGDDPRPLCAIARGVRDALHSGADLNLVLLPEIANDLRRRPRRFGGPITNEGCQRMLDARAVRAFSDELDDVGWLPASGAREEQRCTRRAKRRRDGSSHGSETTFASGARRVNAPTADDRGRICAAAPRHDF